MKYIEGDKLRDVLPSLNGSKKDRYFKILGCYIARLHLNGHVHGDITTSNIIITPQGEVFLIDFGLHDYSDTIEDKSVDIHLLKRVLLSSHGSDFEACYSSFLRGYEEECANKGSKEADLIIRHVDTIESRGRYVKKKDRK